MPINELRSITAFIRTAELGSITKAAESLQISQQAASKALTQLESMLGLRLFHRTTRSVSLTEEGQRFLEATRPSLAGLQRALADARRSKDATAGPLRIVGPRTMLQTVISPVLEEYCRLYPEVVPDVQLEDRIGNWVEDRIDVGFRLGNAPPDGLIARPLMPLQLIVCASPSYLRKHGVPVSLNDLVHHRCSAFRRGSDGRLAPWQVHIDGAERDQHIAPAFSTNDEAIELGAVLAGEVIAQLAGATAAAHIRSGRLVPLLLEHVSDVYSLYLYYGSRASQPARVRAFIDLAIDRLSGSEMFLLSANELAQAHAGGVPRR